jgi:hypothetical protein
VKALPLSRFALCTSLAAALLAACGAPQPPIGAPAVRRSAGAALPANLLYVDGETDSTSRPSIEVFNSQDSSKNPQPIYTIGPRGGGSYGLLAVDDANDLFAVNYFANGAELIIFPSGETRAKIVCVLDNVPRGIFIAANTLYFPTKKYTIEENNLPISHGSGRDCPKPDKVLTDQRAKLRGIHGLWSIAVDRHGDIFDIWQSPIGERIDKFDAGSATARPFASLKRTFGAFYMTSDSSGNLVTSFGSEAPQSDSLAIFLPDGRTHHLFDSIPNGLYLGVAVAEKSTELFAAKDYPQTTVSAYAYYPRKAQVGRILRTFSSGVWSDAQSIAVFSKGR